MKAIVNVNWDWAIGFNGSLLVSIPEDMRFFKEATMGKIVVMGRKTLDSLPGGRPLKGRTNIILTSDPEKINCRAVGGTRLYAAAAREEALKLIAGLSPEGTDGVYIIGGAQIYRLFLNDCDTCLVTVNNITGKADSFFPDLNREPGWRLYEKGEERGYGSIKYSFDTWKKNHEA